MNKKKPTAEMQVTKTLKYIIKLKKELSKQQAEYFEYLLRVTFKSQVPIFD